MPGSRPPIFGFAIPADLSIVSLDDGELLASRLVPPLTTIERPDRAMAEEAVTVTLQRLDEDGGDRFRSSPSTVRLPTGAR